MEYMVLVILACAVSTSKGMTRDERLSHFKALITECAAKEGASSSEVEYILQHRTAKTHEGKCVGACFGSTTHMIKNNKLDVEAVLVMTKIGYDGDATKMDLAREFSSACADITDDERCEAASKIFHCMREHAIAKGLTPDDF